MRSDLNTTPQFSDALHVRGGLSALKWLIVLGIINLYDLGQSDCFTGFLGFWVNPKFTVTPLIAHHDLDLSASQSRSASLHFPPAATNIELPELK